MPEAMTVTVLLFGPLREALGAGEVPWTGPDGTTVQGLAAALLSGRREAGLPLAYAVDGTRCAGAKVLHHGAVVALLPPVGGG